jgi:DNA-binding LytR/AlgR family response regulator
MAKNLRTLIVDDDEMSRMILEQILLKLQTWKLVGSCSNAVEARNVLKTEPVDVLLLDIEMADLNGIDFLKVLKDRPQVIVVSSKEQYALDAFEYEVTDYVLKPVSFERFLKAVDRVEKNFNTVQMENQSSIFVKANNQIVNVNLTDIHYIEAYGDYVNIFTEKDRLVVHSTMKGIESRLPVNQFRRVHRSFIVRQDKIHSIDETLIVIGKKLIPIGESYKTELMTSINLVVGKLR